MEVRGAGRRRDGGMGRYEQSIGHLSGKMEDFLMWSQCAVALIVWLVL